VKEENGAVICEIVKCFAPGLAGASPNFRVTLIIDTLLAAAPRSMKWKTSGYATPAGASATKLRTYYMLKNCERNV
jgi:hypothetical protein